MACRDYFEVQRDDGAIGQWPMDEVAGSTLFDTSGNGRDGGNTGATLGQPSIIPGTTRTCYQLTGSTDPTSVDVSDAAWMDVPAFAVEIVCDPDAANDKVIVGRDTTVGSNRLWLVYLDTGGRLTFSVWNNSGTVATVQGGTSDYALHHIVAQFDGGDVELWRDGSLLASTTLSGTARTGGAPITFGYHGGNQRRMDCFMQGAAFYDRALTPGEVANHYAKFLRGCGGIFVDGAVH